MPELPFPIVDVHAHFPVVHTIGLHDAREEPRHPALEAYARDRQARMHNEWAHRARGAAGADPRGDRRGRRPVGDRTGPQERALAQLRHRSEQRSARGDRPPPPRPLHRLRAPSAAAGRRRRDAPGDRRARAQGVQGARPHDGAPVRGPEPARPLGLPRRAGAARPDPLRVPRARRWRRRPPTHEPAVAVRGRPRLPRDPLHRPALRGGLLRRPVGAVLEPAERLHRHVGQQPVDALDALPADARGPVPQGLRHDRARTGPVRHRLGRLPARLRRALPARPAARVLHHEPARSRHRARVRRQRRAPPEPRPHAPGRRAHELAPRLHRPGTDARPRVRRCAPLRRLPRRPHGPHPDGGAAPGGGRPPGRARGPRRRPPKPARTAGPAARAGGPGSLLRAAEAPRGRDRRGRARLAPPWPEPQRPRHDGLRARRPRRPPARRTARRGPAHGAARPRRRAHRAP